MKRRLAVTLAALALSVIMAVPAYAGTWKYVNDQWKYQKGANKFAFNEWVKDGDKTYYIGNDGYMKTDWQQIEGQWFYLEPESGVLQTGWFKNEGKWYFCYPNGVMAAGTVIDGRQLGADGAWIPAEGETEPVNTVDMTTPYMIQNMEGITKKDYTIIASGKTSSGERLNNAIRLKDNGSFVQYDSNGEYKLLCGAYAPSSQFPSGIRCKLVVSGDDEQVLYETEYFQYSQKKMYFGVDVTGQSKVRVQLVIEKDHGWDVPIVLIDGLALYK